MASISLPSYMAIICGWPHFHKRVAFISYKARTDFHEFDPFSTSNSPTMAHNSKGSDMGFGAQDTSRVREKSPEEQAPAPSKGPTSQDASAASKDSTPQSSRKDLGLE
jgi:hypothetical protein